MDEAWKKLETNTQKAIKGVIQGATQIKPDMNYKLLQALGQGLHAVQDFYSHSTWVNMAVESGGAFADETYLSTAGNSSFIKREGLFTGNYPDSDTDMRSHARINKDTPIDTKVNPTRSKLHPHAMRAAKRASEEWVKKFLTMLKSEAGAKVWEVSWLRSPISQTSNDSVWASYPVLVKLIQTSGHWRADCKE